MNPLERFRPHNELDSPLVTAASGRFSELMMTNPKPSLSFRLMTTSLGCVLAGALSEAAAALGVWVLLAYVKSLRGELCCVDAEQGLRPFCGSPAGGDGEVSRGGKRERAASGARHLANRRWESDN